MQGKCSRCGEQELRLKTDAEFRVGVPWLSRLLQRETKHVCSVCGMEVEARAQSVVDPADYRIRIPHCSGAESRSKEPHWAIIYNTSVPTSPLPALVYSAVIGASDSILFPTFEGRIDDGTVIDRHGDPELMADFAEEYLRQFWTLLPTDRLPRSIREIMPPLLLLFTATELALKVFCIRSGKQATGHSLSELYKKLDSGLKCHIESRFASEEPLLPLSALGADAPTVKAILSAYSKTYGGGSSVYVDSRYYAEPTTLFRKESGLRGANLAKGKTPYPIFLPYVAQSLIDAYRYFSGPERLRRLGADLSEGRGDQDGDCHGDWGLVPSSLGLVVVMVRQADGIGFEGKEVDMFTEFKRVNPTGFIVDWKHGGNTLLFYHDDELGLPDGPHVINGLECRLWSNGRLGMHQRDLHLLADALESSDKHGTIGKLEDRVIKVNRLPRRDSS